MMKKIVPIIGCALLAYLGWSYMDEYLFMHPYYESMLANIPTLKVTFLGLIYAMLPTAYIFFVKKKNLWVLLGTIIGATILFSIGYISIKGGLYGGGVLALFMHYIFLFFLAVLFFIGLEQLGDVCKQKFLKLETTTITDLLLNLGIGLAVFLVIVYVLVLTNLLYTVTSWLLLAGLVLLLWLSRSERGKKGHILRDSLDTLSLASHHARYVLMSLPFLGYGLIGIVHDTMTFSLWLWLLIGVFLFGSYILQASRTNDWGFDILLSRQGLMALLLLIVLVLTRWYLFHGMQLAYLPYPTAWDANHAYMFYPKMWALNQGYYWGEPSMSSSPTLWLMFITFFFSLFGTSSFLGIASDTIAIEMNFWSGLLVLVFGLGLITELIKFLGNHMSSSFYARRITFLVGWFLLLQWLMSGMGAFLVFIDNKTDMGILAFIIIAAYSGFVFLNKLAGGEADLSDEDSDTGLSRKKAYAYLAISGVLYGMAVLAKPTGLFDVVNFGVFLWILWFGWIGGLGLILLASGILTHLNFRGIKQYIPQYLGWILVVCGAMGIGVDGVRVALRKSWMYVRYLLGWSLCIIVTIVVVKVPFLAIDMAVYDRAYSPGTFIQRIFLSKANQGGDARISRPLLAQQGDDLAGQSCDLASLGLSDTDQLYTTTEKASASVYNEDVGRYVGFGWKGNATTDARRNVLPLLNPRWANFLQPGCYGFSPFQPYQARDAKALCQYEASLENLDRTGLMQVVGLLSERSVIGDVSVQQKVQELIDLLGSSSADEIRAAYAPDINDLRSFMQNSSIKIQDKAGVREVYFPYLYLTPANITFNWSLQNLSSYYTDIGIIWLLLFVFTFVGLIYGSIIQQHKLIALSIVTIFGWILWWMIGGAILRYAIGLVVWTILAFVAYVYYLIHDEDIQRLGIGDVFLLIFLVFACRQMILNMVRIGSQGGSGAFLWYKTNSGQEQVYNEQLQPINSLTSSFGQDDVFALQFPHYRPFLALANARADDEGALIAGTYARYFVEEQHHIQYDQFLTWLWEMFSDGDVCKSYLRLQDKHIKYIVIDPNIGTVVQGAGNQSLFDRFFARVDMTGNEIVEHGTMTMLVELYRAGHIRYVSSNNLGAKYAFILPDATFAGISGDTLTLARARMALARFFNSGAIISSIVQVAQQRVQDGTFITDLADLLGVDIREDHILGLIQKGQLLPEDIIGLSNDERKILSQYLSLRQLAVNSPEQYTQQLQSLVQSSIAGGNQILVLEVVE